MEERLKKIVEEWYLCEPALFMAYCTHSLRENRSMGTAMRSGQRVIEFNPDLMRHWDNHTISERLKLEVIRILLGHPYQRQPHNAIPAALGLSSDITLNTLYPSNRLLPVPADLKVPQKLCFEEYYRIILKYIHDKADSQDKNLKNEDRADLAAAILTVFAQTVTEVKDRVPRALRAVLGRRPSVGADCEFCPLCPSETCVDNTLVIII